MTKKTKTYSQSEYEKFVRIFEQIGYTARQYLGVGTPGPKFVTPDVQSYKKAIQAELKKLP